LPLATTMQPHDKGHQKVNIHKIGLTAIMNCLLSLNWPMLHQTLAIIVDTLVL